MLFPKTLCSSTKSGDRSQWHQKKMWIPQLGSNPRPQPQRCLRKEQEVSQLEKVRHITRKGTLDGKEAG